MKILYLYHDLMNLYGESGNLRALERHLADQGEEVSVDRRTLGDALCFDGYDFLYIGAGTERSQKAALEHLRPYAGALKEALDGGMHALLTGNAASMAGREIVDGLGKIWSGLGLLDFTAREQAGVRYTGDAVAAFPEIEQPLVGFINKCDDWTGRVPPLFRMVMGRGNRGEGGDEGFRQGTLLGTHLIGPVLVKNTAFHAWLVGRMLGREPESVSYPSEEKAWKVTYEALMARRDVPSET